MSQIDNFANAIDSALEAARPPLTTGEALGAFDIAEDGLTMTQPPLSVYAAIPAPTPSELGERPTPEKPRTDWKSSEFEQPALYTQACDVQTVPRTLSLPEDDATRASYPMADGCLDYFPNALAEVSKISYEGNLKHNPGEPMHWNRGKSLDHRNKIMRHTVESKLATEQAIYHAAQAAWRALAELQQKIEGVRGVPMAPGARAPST